MIKFLKSNLFSHFWILLKGSGFRQLFSILSTIILTRLYSPSDYGILAVYNSITIILFTISTLRLEITIPLASSDSESRSLASANMFILFLNTTIVTLILFVVFKIGLIDFPDNIIGVNFFVFLISCSVFFNGSNTIIQNRLLFLEKYSLISYNGILMIIIQFLAQFCFVFYFKTGFGLIYGQVIARTITVLVYLVLPLKLFSIIDFNTITKYLSQKRKFIFYALPSELLSKGVINIIPVFISIYFNNSLVGFYSISNKIVGLPISLIGNNFRQILLKESSKEYLQHGTIIKAWSKVAKVLSITGVTISILIMLFAPLIFPLLGNNWSNSIVVTYCLIPFFLSQIVFVPLMGVLNTINRQELLLFYYTGLAVSLGILFVLKLYLINISFYFLLVIISVLFFSSALIFSLMLRRLIVRL